LKPSTRLTFRARRAFVVHLRAERDVDAIRSLRALLKVALRRFGLRAVEVREVEPPPVIIRFPPRRMCAVIICREREVGGWLVIARAHGWLFGSLADARAEARWLADNLGLPIRELVMEHSS
jgi:hypothetical protein